MGSTSNGVIKELSLSKKLREKVKENLHVESSQSGLVAVVDDNILVWSREDCCFYAQHLHHKDAVLQTLCVTRPPLWSVQRICLNSSGTGVLVVGKRGVGVVDLPQRWGKHHAFDGGREHTTCRIEYIAERFLVSHQRVTVVAAHWHPGSPYNNHVVMLATDHYLRVYSLRSRDVPEQALAISVPRSDSVFCSRRDDVPQNSAATRLGASVLGEEAVDFTIAAPVLPKPTACGDVGDGGGVISGGDGRCAAAADLLWPVFVLYANGDVYHTSLTLHPTKVRSRSVSGPLLLLPARQDNYDLEWCSISWLGEGGAAGAGGVGGVIVLATSSARLHHCVVVPAHPPQQDVEKVIDEKKIVAFTSEARLVQELSALSVGASTAPAVSLFVYESVDLELSLCDEEHNIVCPLMLYKDSTAPNRYLVLHAAGVHAVTVPLVDSLRQFALASDTPAAATALADDGAECSVEHLVCTRALPSSDALAVLGAAIWPADCQRHANRLNSSGSSGNELVVLLATGTILSIRLPSILLSIPVLDPLSVSTSDSKCDSPAESFESMIQAVLQRGSSQPVLACGSTATLDPVEALDLTNRTLHTLRSQYIAPQATAQQHILHRVRVMYDQQRALCAQVNSVQQQRQQLLEQTQRLQEQQEQANLRQQDISNRLDAVVSTALRQVPGLSGGERWLLKQLHSIQEQLPHLSDDMQHLSTKLNWHSNSAQADSAGDAEAQSQDLKLSQPQLHLLKKNISAESEKIDSLVSRFNSLQKNLQA
uniref:Nuclear pore complex protein Nup88-like n=1 Tax=Hirondellea gigas TaxID=1518452 RepID=A0A2P2I0W0_9CRUS